MVMNDCDDDSDGDHDKSDHDSHNDCDEDNDGGDWHLLSPCYVPRCQALNSPYLI